LAAVMKDYDITCLFQDYHDRKCLVILLQALVLRDRLQFSRLWSKWLYYSPEI